MKFVITSGFNDHRFKRTVSAPDAKTARQRFVARCARDRITGWPDEVVYSVDSFPCMTNVVLLPWVKASDL